MEQGRGERRRGRRISLQAPLLIRRLAQQGAELFQELLTQNVSMAGIYFETDNADAFAMNESVMTSVSIPEIQRREFPFTRLAGRGRVVRVEALAHAQSPERKRIGIAIEFGEDLTALTAIPHR